MDKLSPQQRSDLMRRVKREDTAPEIRVRKAAHRLGFRYRLHRHDLPGSPDLVFPRLRIALFVHGCFWHRHPSCRFATTPKTRQEFWLNKFSQNIERDKRIVTELEAMGWHVATIWECDTRDERKLETLLVGILGGK